MERDHTAEAPDTRYNALMPKTPRKPAQDFTQGALASAERMIGGPEKGRVERWRGGVSTLRFHPPLIEPDVRISRIRLSEKVHAFAFGRRLGSHLSWSRPNVSSSQGLHRQRGCSLAPLCLASHHLPNRYRTCELMIR